MLQNTLFSNYDIYDFRMYKNIIDTLMKYQMNCEIICELEPDKRRSAVQVRISP